MRYIKIKTILYCSEEIQLIPDGWVESVPFKCMLNNEEYDAFLFWDPLDNQVELKRMICINSNSGAIVVLDSQDLIKKFGLQTLVFQIPAVKDYDVYFADLGKYDTLYSSLCLSENAYNQVGKEEYLLFSKIVGTDLLLNAFSKIAGNYLNKLQSGTI